MSMGDYVDRQAGLNVTGGDPDLLKEVTKTYWSNLDREMETIQTNLNTNLEEYIIAVHGLKSTSRAIGAMTLGDMAYECEMAGKAGDTEKINALTPPLIEYVKGFKAELDKEFSDAGTPAGSLEISDADIPEIKTKLRKLVAALNDYDCDTAEDVVDELEQYAFTGEAADLFENMCDAIASFDYDGCRESAEVLIGTI
ncbi:MAG: Hpt domain-containing protein [Lachnospiraceae bacterium]|nr:Hpt domain-containing protein [Lachnospiraceae bacterium]